MRGLSQPILLQTPFVQLRWHDVEPQCTTLAALTKSLQRANSAYDKQAVSRCRYELQRFWHHAPGGHHLRQCGADVVGYKAFGPGRWSFLTTSLNNKQPLWIWEEDGKKTQGQGNLANEVQGVRTRLQKRTSRRKTDWQRRKQSATDHQWTKSRTQRYYHQQGWRSSDDSDNTNTDTGSDWSDLGDSGFDTSSSEGSDAAYDPGFVVRGSAAWERLQWDRALDTDIGEVSRWRWMRGRAGRSPERFVPHGHNDGWVREDPPDTTASE